MTISNNLFFYVEVKLYVLFFCIINSEGVVVYFYENKNDKNDEIQMWPIKQLLLN